jgi:hypothetical protein
MLGHGLLQARLALLLIQPPRLTALLNREVQVDCYRRSVVPDQRMLFSRLRAARHQQHCGCNDEEGLHAQAPFT